MEGVKDTRRVTTNIGAAPTSCGRAMLVGADYGQPSIWREPEGVGLTITMVAKDWAQQSGSRLLFRIQKHHCSDSGAITKTKTKKDSNGNERSRY